MCKIKRVWYFQGTTRESPISNSMSEVENDENEMREDELLKEETEQDKREKVVKRNTRDKLLGQEKF